MITVSTYRAIRSAIDAGYPSKGLSMIDSLLKGKTTSEERETLAILMGKANRKAEALCKE